MSLKDLFIVNNDKPVKKEPSKATSKLKFPTGESSNSEETPSKISNFGFGKSVTPSVNADEVSEEHLNKAIEIYQNGFDSLNQGGYDFYEYFQTVSQGGITNPQTYKMAFAMGTAMDKSVTKAKLLQQSDFYVSEINKVYNDYVTKGNAKKKELVDQKIRENQSLVGELDLMKDQLEALKTQIQDRENKLASIDDKYFPKISELDSKLAANDIAKNKVIESIELVKEGITNNLK
jgi:hypothetical protein